MTLSEYYSGLNEEQKLYFRWVKQKYLRYMVTDMKRFGTVLDFSISDMGNRIHLNKCDYCGHNYSLGLDRLNNKKGHTLSNTTVCCALCNQLRRDQYSFAEMKKIGSVLKDIHRDVPAYTVSLPHMDSSIEIEFDSKYEERKKRKMYWKGLSVEVSKKGHSTKERQGGEIHIDGKLEHIFRKHL